MLNRRSLIKLCGLLPFISMPVLAKERTDSDAVKEFENRFKAEYRSMIKSLPFRIIESESKKAYEEFIHRDTGEFSFRMPAVLYNYVQQGRLKDSDIDLFVKFTIDSISDSLKEAKNTNPDGRVLLMWRRRPRLEQSSLVESEDIKCMVSMRLATHSIDDSDNLPTTV